MRLFIDDKNVIVGYEIEGNSTEGIEYLNTLPDDFEIKFKPSFYIIQNGLIVKNPDYEEIKVPTVGPSTTEQQLAALTYQQMQDSQEKQALIKQNAQMAYQIMQIQQQLGGQKA